MQLQHKLKTYFATTAESYKDGVCLVSGLQIVQISMITTFSHVCNKDILIYQQASEQISPVRRKYFNRTTSMQVLVNSIRRKR
jgi:hypothetical protein